MTIPDPIEILEYRIDKLTDEYIYEYTCMNCKRKVYHDLVCMTPTGDGPAVCEECAEIERLR